MSSVLRTPTRSAYGSALRRLARRDHSERELRTALLAEGHEEGEVEECLTRLRTARYLDDRRFAETFTRSRLAHHGQGRARIRHGLRTRGVAGEVVERALEQIAGDGSEQETLDAVARKYWRLHTRHEPAARMRRLWAFLLRRGFPGGLVHDRLRALWPKHGDGLSDLEALESETD
jgi:regulatory protein